MFGDQSANSAAPRGSSAPSGPGRKCSCLGPARTCLQGRGLVSESPSPRLSSLCPPTFGGQAQSRPSSKQESVNRLNVMPYYSMGSLFVLGCKHQWIHRLCCEVRSDAQPTHCYAPSIFLSMSAAHPKLTTSLHRWMLHCSIIQKDILLALLCACHYKHVDDPSCFL